MTDSLYWSFYLVPLGVTAACLLLYAGHGLYLGYRRRLRVARASGSATLDSSRIKAVIPTREDWGWFPAFATALILVGIFVFATRPPLA
ncbi:hypothetical protein [Rhizobium sp. 2MFCol3.1]|uniref:hypothetical protein n=1 Tax=Rhizobium sp. 2MFCol3.1 TaxID=1246459 RepID=UPI0003724405|nr:hypothetical protein [Rhizobium sp. 2MFCol3.1]